MVLVDLSPYVLGLWPKIPNIVSAVVNHMPGTYCCPAADLGPHAHAKEALGRLGHSAMLVDAPYAAAAPAPLDTPACWQPHAGASLMA